MNCCSLSADFTYSWLFESLTLRLSPMLSHVLDDLETKRNIIESKLSLYLIERRKVLTNPE